jgi:2,3-bisphosphoglycerate-independent phosphoglycerate mutase
VARIVNYNVMKYVVVIMDGASGWPLEEKGGKTCLELANVPNLTAMAREGEVGLVQTVPKGMEPSSACACMSVLGYDPQIYYKGRSGIEAISMSVPIRPGDVVFRCNLVSIIDGKMRSYSAGHISTEEARLLIETLNEKLGDESVNFFPGTNYRHICRIAGKEELLDAICTPPHDISDKPIAEFLPHGAGSELLRKLMDRSREVLKVHPVNKQRLERGDLPATMIWLFWASGKIPAMPAFKDVYGLSAAMTSGVDLLKGLAQMAHMEVLHISGVTDDDDNDYEAQVNGAVKALENHDLVIIHIEAPDESGHEGSASKKVSAIEEIDKKVLSRFCHGDRTKLRVLVMPDHPTPIKIRTHCDEPVPFLLWGQGFKPSGAIAFSESEARRTGIFIAEGFRVMDRLVRGKS